MVITFILSKYTTVASQAQAINYSYYHAIADGSGFCDEDRKRKIAACTFFEVMRVWL
ncbi:hypothetical protein OH492_00540 [Vibrio chagasii]|nr:hypothetical protein [Vibrio chagasii]